MCPQKDDKFAEPTYGFSLLNSFLCSEYFFCFLFFSFLLFIVKSLRDCSQRFTNRPGPTRLGPPRSRFERSLLKLRDRSSFGFSIESAERNVAQNDAWKNVSSASRSLLHTFYRCEEIVNSKKKKDNERYRKWEFWEKETWESSGNVFRIKEDIEFIE